MLEPEATAYLHRLVDPGRRTHPRRRKETEKVPDGIRQLVMSRADLPATVLGRYQDVLLSNPLAIALNPANTPGVNALRAAFLDPGVRALHEDGWDHIAAGLVAAVRAMAGPETRDPHLAELVGELSVRSEEFRRLWARHDVRPRTSGAALLQHPQVGPMRLSYEKLAITGTDGQVLVLFHAAPGSAAADSLALLALLARLAAEPEPTPDPRPHR